MTQQHLTPLRLLFILLLVASGVLGAGNLGAQSEGVGVSYSLESSATTMHEPIIVRFEVYNGSKEPMTVQLGAWPPNVQTTAGTRAILAQQALQKIVATTSNERLKQEINGVQRPDGIVR